MPLTEKQRQLLKDAQRYILEIDNLVAQNDYKDVPSELIANAYGCIDMILHPTKRKQEKTDNIQGQTEF